MTTLISIVHVITCFLLILVVLIQSGKGAEISASFGGSSQTVFGSSGGANFFTHLTQGLAGVFMITSILLTVYGSESKKSLFEGVANAQPTTAASAVATLPSNLPSATPSQQPAATK